MSCRFVSQSKIAKCFFLFIYKSFHVKETSTFLCFSNSTLKIYGCRNRRKKRDPRTPDKFDVCSRRCWDGAIKAWKLRIHKIVDDWKSSKGAHWCDNSGRAWLQNVFLLVIIILLTVEYFICNNTILILIWVNRYTMFIYTMLFCLSYQIQ